MKGNNRHLYWKIILQSLLGGDIIFQGEKLKKHTKKFRTMKFKVHRHRLNIKINCTSVYMQEIINYDTWKMMLFVVISRVGA